MSPNSAAALCAACNATRSGVTPFSSATLRATLSRAGHRLSAGEKLIDQLVEKKLVQSIVCGIVQLCMLIERRIH